MVVVASYYRPYKKLGTHIKSHSITPAEWQTLKMNKGPFKRSLWTDYYDGRRIYSIIDEDNKRTIWYREILSQKIEVVESKLDLDLDLDLDLERVTEHCLTLDFKTWVNHYPHDHIRQKLVYESSLYTLEILFDEVKPKEHYLGMDLDLENENIISLSYVLKTKD